MVSLQTIVTTIIYHSYTAPYSQSNSRNQWYSYDSLQRYYTLERYHSFMQRGPEVYNELHTFKNIIFQFELYMQESVFPFLCVGQTAF